MTTAVLIPVKALTDAKHRLSPRFNQAERQALARAMAEIVVKAAANLPVFVVCDDDEIAAWARSSAAEVIWKPGRGLNGAVREAVAELGAEGASQVVVSHADLPLAQDLSVAVGFPGVTLVPDRHRDGTNVCAVDPAAGFEFAYGAKSFQSHLQEATRLGLPVRVIDDRRLSWDIDRPDDLLTPSDLRPELDALVDAAIGAQVSDLNPHRTQTSPDTDTGTETETETEREST